MTTDVLEKQIGELIASVDTPSVRLDTAWRGAGTSNGEVMLWNPELASADAANLHEAPKIRARARDMVRNEPFAANAVRMRTDAVVGTQLKLSLKPDFRALGITMEEATVWADAITREWEGYAESSDFYVDARRQQTFSQLFALVDRTIFVDGEALAIIESKRGIGPYRTCLNIIDVDRLSTPPLKSESLRLRDGVELDRYGEPIAYHIREAHPADFIHDPRSYQWKRVRRRTLWGRAIALHIFDHGRAEMTRGVSEFATAIVPMKMLARYNDTELQSAIIQASYAAVIESELDYSDALAAIGADKFKDAKNPITKMALDHLENITPYHKEMGITFNGAKIAHLPPNEKLHMMGSNHPNGNFDKFEGAFLRRFAAGLGVENHELSKNYADLNYSAARTALAAVWRTYQARREKSVKAFAMPFFAAWMEEAWATGQITLPGKITDFHAYKPALARGTFIGNGKPLIDPVKERKGQQLGMAMGAETLEDVCARDGQNWRDNLEQIAYERRVRAEYGLPEPVMEGEKRQHETTEGEGAKE